MSKYASKRRIKNFNDLVDKIERQLDVIEESDPESVVGDRWRGYFQKYRGDEQINEAAFNKMYKQARDLYESGALSPENVERSIGGAISTIRNKFGIDIDRRNFNSFMRFLDDARARGLAKVYDSEQILNAIAEAKKKGLTKAQIQANIDRWAKKAVKLDAEGKQIEIINPPEIKVRRIQLKRGRKRR